MPSFKSLYLCFFFGVFFNAFSQKEYQIHTLAFYNLENLFDTLNDPKTFDDDRTPKGRDRWNSKVYHQKINNMAKVIADIGYDTTQSAPVLVGVCEVENETVLQDLITSFDLIGYNYGYIHEDSPD